MTAGSASSALFTSTTSPAIGLYRSDTAFTASIVPKDSCCAAPLSRLREVHEHDVAQLALRIVGDPDPHDGWIIAARDVFVLAGVLQIVWDVGHGGLVLGTRVGG